MVLPITGPTGFNHTTAFGIKSGVRYKQGRPYNLVLDYSMTDSFGVRRTNYWQRDGSATSAFPARDTSFSLTAKPDYAKIRNATFNKAYSRLKEKSGPGSGWLENIATVNQSRRLLADSLFRIGSVVKSLRKGRFDEVTIALGLAATPSGVSRRKHISQNFLAYEYGVKPLIKDVQESWALLTSDPGVQRIRATATGHLRGQTATVESVPGFFGSTNTVWSGQVRIALSAYLRIYNPDIFLANKLGLLDLALPWKLIPFSFIVDWFINMEDCISFLTDWYGCTLEQPYTTEFARGVQAVHSFTGFYYADGTSEGNTWNAQQSFVRLIRTGNIAGPVFQVKPFKGFSLERGAQAIALVLSVFGK